jgi:hypothetical protein
VKRKELMTMARSHSRETVKRRGERESLRLERIARPLELPNNPCGYWAWHNGLASVARTVLSGPLRPVRGARRAQLRADLAG